MTRWQNPKDKQVFTLPSYIYSSPPTQTTLTFFLLNAWCEIVRDYQSTKSAKARRGWPRCSFNHMQKLCNAILAANRTRNPLRSWGRSRSRQRYERACRRLFPQSDGSPPGSAARTSAMGSDYSASADRGPGLRFHHTFSRIREI
jgi:hypothetical protein